MAEAVKKNKILKKVGRIILKTLIGVILFLLLIIGLILLPPVQTFIVKKAAGYLENKIHTPVSIGKLYIGFPKTVVVEKIYLQDKTSDTLLYAGAIKVNIGLMDLITGNGISVDRVELNQLTAKVNRLLPDTSFNFQYIIDAFASNKPEPEVKDSSAATPISLGTIELNEIRAVYKDVVTGYDAEIHLGHFDTDISNFDLEKMEFAVKSLELADVNARVHQALPLVTGVSTTEVEEIADTTSITPRIDLGAIQFKNINADYKSEAAAIAAIINLGDLKLETQKIDLAKNTFNINELLLNNTTANITLAKKAAADTAKASATTVDSSATGSGMHLYAKRLQLNNTNIQFNDENAPVQKSGMDYMHLKADSLTFHINDLVFSNDTIAGKIDKASLKEKSGFELQQLTTRFLYSSTQASLTDLYIKTPGTEIKRSLAIQYPSLEAMQKDINSATLDLNIENSRVQVKDILTFVPTLKDMPAFANPNAYLVLNSALKGRLNDLQIRQLQLSALQDTKVDISGTLKGLPDIDKLDGNLTIKNISSSKRDIVMLAPANSLPDNIEIPQKMQVSGTVRGTAGRLNTQLDVNTSLGNLMFKGQLFKITDPNASQYDIDLRTIALQLGTLLKDTANFGAITANLKAKGKGLDPKKMDASFSGKVISAVLKHYNYKDLVLEGNIAQQQAAINAAIADPNIHIKLDAQANLAQQYPAVKLNVNIDSIKTKELHLTADELVYRGQVDADFQSTNPDSLAGKLFILQSLLVHNQNRVQLDTLQLMAEAQDTLRRMEIKSDFLNVLLSGRYKLTEMGSVIQETIQPYYNMRDSSSVVKNADHDFTLNARLVNAPVLKAFMPDLKRLDSVTIAGRFSSSEAVNLAVAVPVFHYGANVINGFSLDADTEGEALKVNAHVNNAAVGEGLRINQTNINASIADNKIDLALRLNDREDKQQYFIRSFIEQFSNNSYRFSLAPDSLMLDHETWTVDPQNSISFQQNDLKITQFNLSKNQQQLNINSTSEQQNAPIQVDFKDFKIATITAFVQPDTSLANGVINGGVTLENVMQQPVFTGDLAVTDVSFKKDTIGNLKIKVDNKMQDTYAAAIAIDGNGNDLQVNANYYTNTSSFDADLIINQLPMTTVQAVSGGALRESSGMLKGKFDVNGSFDKPVVNGSLDFDKTAFNLSMLNSYFKIDQEKLEINNEGIRFNRFQIKDSANNQLSIDGTAATENFRNYKLDLTVRADNFRALNSTQRDNQLFYGKLYFDSNLKIKGTETSPEVDGRLKINDKTDMTVVMPQKEPGVVEREGIVLFVDKDFPPPIDSMFLAKTDSLNNTSMQGMNISVNVETDKKAKFKLIVDQGSGDALDIQGGAQLTAGVEPGGKIALAGVYEIEDGGYNLSFNLLKRKFKIEKGSKITWEGEPTSATVAITALYTSNTSPLDLVKNQLRNDISVSERNTYMQKIPFQVLLKMEGELMQPKISFDIILPEGNNNVSTSIINDINTKLAMLRQDEAEMNKQVFALLLLNRFVSENPFSNSNSTSTSTLVMQSVNKFMTEQLNQWASDLVKGVDINFDLESTDDFSTGTRESRTDLNVGLSKRLLNDRLTVSVGSNFELDGPQQGSNQQGSNIAGNITVDYRLTEDGRYMLRGYRKNNYQGVIEGYIIETGIGFVITMDYNRFREIFEKRKDRKQNRIQRRQAKRDAKQNESEQEQ